MKYNDLLNKEDYQIIQVFEFTKDSFVCSICAEIKTLSECYVLPKRGVKTRCKECHNFNRKCDHYKNPQYSIDKNNEWLKNNKEKRRLFINDYMNTRNKTDILFNLICKIRGRTKSAFRTNNWKKQDSITEALGCSPKELRDHLVSKFTEKMTEQDILNGNIHIDHIIPLSSAKTPEDLYKLTHYTNLQPLWAIDNLKKGNRIK